MASIIFRTDASLQIGTGHVMRCLTLADALHERGARCTFICRPHRGHLLETIGRRGHKALVLKALDKVSDPFDLSPAHASWLGTNWQTDAQDTRCVLDNEPADWMVVDHYALDWRWEQALKPHCQNLMVIDDLADRPHDCEVLLDQNLGRSDQDYSRLLNPNTTTFIGPRYALLRPEFVQFRSQSLARRVNPQLKHLLITMGGVDKDNVTGQVLQALRECDLPSACSITVVMGGHAPHLSTVQEQAEQMPWLTQVLVGVNNMAQLMAESDLCIGAAGSTAWERCCLGLPAWLLVLAENQRAGAHALQQSGAALVLDNPKDLRHILQSSSRHDILFRLNQLGKSASCLTDGTGVRRIVSFIEVYQKYV